jgi:hypothetical protein
MAGKGDRVSVTMMLIGLAVALAAFVSLLLRAFHWIDLVYYLPALALAAALIFIGRARIRKNNPPAGKK